MANPWLVHVKSTMASMKKSGTYKTGDGLTMVIMEAKKTYGGAAGGKKTQRRKTRARKTRRRGGN